MSFTSCIGDRAVDSSGNVVYDTSGFDQEFNDIIVDERLIVGVSLTPSGTGPNYIQIKGVDNTGINTPVNSCVLWVDEDDDYNLKVRNPGGVTKSMVKHYFHGYNNASTALSIITSGAWTRIPKVLGNLGDGSITPGATYSSVTIGKAGTYLFELNICVATDGSVGSTPRYFLVAFNLNGSFNGNQETAGVITSSQQYASIDIDTGTTNVHTSFIVSASANAVYTVCVQNTTNAGDFTIENLILNVIEL